jgi:hypothetical protein
MFACVFKKRKLTGGARGCGFFSSARGRANFSSPAALLVSRKLNRKSWRCRVINFFLVSDQVQSGGE